MEVTANAVNERIKRRRMIESYHAIRLCSMNKNRRVNLREPN
jgi:hypothetical protein